MSSLHNKKPKIEAKKLLRGIIHAFCRKSDHVNNTQNDEIINVNFYDENFLSVVKSIIDEKMIIIIFSE